MIFHDNSLSEVLNIYASFDLVDIYMDFVQGAWKISQDY